MLSDVAWKWKVQWAEEENEEWTWMGAHFRTARLRAPRTNCSGLLQGYMRQESGSPEPRADPSLYLGTDQSLDSRDQTPSISSTTTRTVSPVLRIAIL